MNIEPFTPGPDSQPPLPPAGWLHDSTGTLRWWDGRQWGPSAPVAQYAPQPAPVIVRSAKETGIAYLLAIFLGGLGVHHFYLGRTGVAVTILILSLLGTATTWLFIGFFLIAVVWVWLIIDLFLIPSYVRSANNAM